MATKSIVAAIAASIAQTSMASIIYLTPNEGGGEIALRDERGGCANGTLLAVSYAGNGKTFKGCWTHDKGASLIIVRWERGDLRVYQDWIFRPTEQKPKPTPNKRSIT